MESLFPFIPEPLTVSDLTRLIKDRIESDELLSNVRVVGEVSNFTQSSAGHLYFTLKDEEAQLRCVMWRTHAIRARQMLRDGARVVAYGRVGVYERSGVYQLYATDLEPAGLGQALAELERLKQRLAAEGLFDVSRKRPLPRLPAVIGIVTSLEAAALQDVLNVLRRRNPTVRVIISPTLVQGDDAPPQIVNAIRRLNVLQQDDRPDVILVVRGGGSLEELNAFNHEAVVRAVAASRIPVVSGVGHEVDVTLTDLAADVRAPTPSVAAELVTPITADALRERLDEYVLISQRALSERLAASRDRLSDVARALVEATALRCVAGRNRLLALQQALRLLRPQQRLTQQRASLRELQRRLDFAQHSRLRSARDQFQRLAVQVRALGPLNTLARGYAIVLREDGSVVQRVAQALPGERLRVQVSDGAFGARVEP